MECELVPDPGADDPVTRAVVTALGRSGLLDGGSGSPSSEAWRRAGLEEAIEQSVAADPALAYPAAANPYGVGSPPGDTIGRGSVPPVRSNPGATRA